MKVLGLGLLLVGMVALTGCMGEWQRGVSWAPGTSRAARISPYMPTIHDEEKLRTMQLHCWVEVHLPKVGLVGYLETAIRGKHDAGGPEQLYYVYNADLERIGFFTELGATYRYLFDDYKQTKKFIGHYEPKEGIAHLLKLPVQLEIKPLKGKAPKF
jgi:hypothetical protein